MPLMEFKKDAVICKENEQLNQLYFITGGTAKAMFNGHEFNFEKGDIIGLAALKNGVHAHTYTAATDMSVLAYPYSDFGSLSTLMNENANTAHLLANAMCRQLVRFLQFRAAFKKEADTAYNLALEMYPKYELLSSKLAFTAKKFSELYDLTAPSETDPVPGWMRKYYFGIKNIDTTIQKELFRNADITMGILQMGASDMPDILESCRLYQNFLKELAPIFINENGHDLFALMSELYFSSANIKGADAAIEPLILQLNNCITEMTHINKETYQQRLGQYKNSLIAKRAAQGTQTTVLPGAGATKQNLADSLNIILTYSGCPEEVCNKFARNIHEYTNVHDRTSSDDDVFQLRKQLTAQFNEIYQAVALKAVKEPSVTTIIKMFLNFGYVDAALAGHENADYLYSIADSLKGDAELNTYTISEWLTDIYKGDKEPSRNDFDTDYAAHIQEQLRMRQITDKDAPRLLADQEGKVRFELEQVFPILNKITFGRITSFCPPFADHNVQRALEAAMITPVKLREMLDEIRAIDFSAFYREKLYANQPAGIKQESVHVEQLPDFILMPNVGMRGAMWQDIEGTNRATPSRMFFPLFLVEDLKTILIRLVAEFRWELCKRIQGVRWSDVTDPSLTSKFFDYLQFYRTNRELSTEVKANIKTELTRARNQYKSVFVMNYAEWLMYESNGSPRLNKTARTILLEYCPFASNIRERLMNNPQFSDMLKRYNTKQQQKIQRLHNVLQRVGQNYTKPIPELNEEIEYLGR